MRKCDILSPVVSATRTPARFVSSRPSATDNRRSTRGANRPKRALPPISVSYFSSTIVSATASTLPAVHGYLAKCPPSDKQTQIYYTAIRTNVARARRSAPWLETSTMCSQTRAKGGYPNGEGTRHKWELAHFVILRHHAARNRKRHHGALRRARTTVVIRCVYSIFMTTVLPNIIMMAVLNNPG